MRLFSPAAFGALLKEIPKTWHLALPIALGMVGHSLVQLTDALMLGHYRTLDLAAAAFGGMMVVLILFGGLGIGQAVSALASQALGAGKNERARGILYLGLWTAFVYSAAGVVLTLGLMPVFDWMRQEAAVAALAKPYALWVALSFIPALNFQTLRNYYEALNKPWVPFAFMLALLGLNIFLNWVFIYGKLGAPELGVTGAGVATFLARTIIAAGLFLHSKKPQGVLAKPFDRKGVPLELLGTQLRMAASSGAQIVVSDLAFIVGGIWIGTLGASALAANRIVGMIDAAIYMIPVGLSYAMANRVGRAYGAGNLELARVIYRGGVLLALLFCAAASAGMIVFREQIFALFSGDPQIQTIGVSLLLIAALFRVFDGVDCVSIGALRGLGDVVVPAGAYMGLFWLVAMPLAWVLGFDWQLGAEGVWWGYCSGIMLSGLFMVGRFVWVSRSKSGKTAIAAAPAQFN